MPVKTNMSCLIIFRMSAHASMTLLTEPAAARLPPRVPGRVVVAAGNELDVAQTALVSDEDIRSAVAFAVRTWPKVDDLYLPEMPAGGVKLDMPSPRQLHKPAFTEDDFIEIAIENFDGVLKADPIHKHIAPHFNTTQGKAREVYRQIVARPSVEYQGEQYDVQRTRGGGFRLVKAVGAGEAEEEEELPETTTESGE